MSFAMVFIWMSATRGGGGAGTNGAGAGCCGSTMLSLEVPSQMAPIYCPHLLFNYQLSCTMLSLEVPS